MSREKAVGEDIIDKLRHPEIKPLDLSWMPEALLKAEAALASKVEHIARLESENAALREELKQTRGLCGDPADKRLIVALKQTMREAAEEVEKACPCHDAPQLILEPCRKGGCICWSATVTDAPCLWSGHAVAAKMREAMK